MPMLRITVIIMAWLTCVASLPQVDAQEKSSRQVTSADLPRIAHTEPDAAIDTFQLARGFQLELVASEPLVSDPVDACFDELGRMYVAEMHGYPFSQEPTKLNPKGGGKKDAGIIRLLEDRDGDGLMDHSTVFADQLSWPTSVCCYKGGIFALAPRFLYYLKDTDGDLKADVREIVLEGFERDNVQSLANCLKWSLDNHIYFAAGRNPINLKHRGKSLFPVRGSDLRFDPRTEEFVRVTGGQQFGHSMDNWGNRFVCSNSNHIQQIIHPVRYLERNPYLPVTSAIRSIAKDGASARVFRTSRPEPWRIIRQKWRAEAKGYKLVVNDDGSWEFLPLDPSKKKGVVPTEYPVGFFTSATGVTIYRGDAYPAEFQGNAFVGDVGGNLVHRKTVLANGVTFSASRADVGEEFIRSSDNWFRPVNFVNAPDGTLYVLDMYRETVEHPYSIPEEIKKFLHLTSGHDRGRIYRIVHPKMKRTKPVFPGQLSPKDLVALLESSNGWHRETAQRLLWEKQDKAVVHDLKRLAVSSQSSLARVHALYTLDGLGALDSSVLMKALSCEQARVREHAIKLSESHYETVPELVDKTAALWADADERVRYQVALSLGEAPANRAATGLERIARDRTLSGDLRIAFLSSVTNVADDIVGRMIVDKGFLTQSHARSVLSELSVIAGTNREDAVAIGVLGAISASDISLSIQQVILTSLGEGLSRRNTSLSKVLDTIDPDSSLSARVDLIFARARKTAHDSGESTIERSLALGLLAFSESEATTELLGDFLSPKHPHAIQLAAVAALKQHGTELAAQTMLKNWTAYEPKIKSEILDAVMSRRSHVRLLLSKMPRIIKPGSLSQDKRQLLLNHPDKEIKSRSLELLGAVSVDRATVVRRFQQALDLEGSRDRGFEVFKKNCSICHQVGELGHKVAPELKSVKNKSDSDLLISILDPSREAQAAYTTYTIATQNGKIYNGMIAAESSNSITLRRAEGKEDVILRAEIEAIESSGKSLMPDGLEKEMTPQQIADVIAFVKAIDE